MRIGITREEKDELLRREFEECDPHEGMGAIAWPLGLMAIVVVFLTVAFLTGLVRFEKKGTSPVSSEGVKGGGG